MIVRRSAHAHVSALAGRVTRTNKYEFDHDRQVLPDKATWYLVTNLPRPGGPPRAGQPAPGGGLAEVVRIYGIRHWTKQGYKQVKDELGWAEPGYLWPWRIGAGQAFLHLALMINGDSCNDRCRQRMDRGRRR